MNQNAQDKWPKVTRNNMRIASGGYINFARPELASIAATDIAIGLSNTCRFGGQLDEWYSVAEHSLLCLTVARYLGCSLEEQRSVLMHDAAEAFVGDMPSPLKLMLPGYSRIERDVDWTIKKRFRLLLSNPDVVKQIDLMLLRLEKEHFFGNQDQWHLLDSVRDVSDVVTIRNLGRAEAREQFLDAMLALGIENA